MFPINRGEAAITYRYQIIQQSTLRELKKLKKVSQP